MSHTLSAYHASVGSEEVRRIWFDWWGSWVVAGGPAGRWVWGVVWWGYEVLDTENGRDERGDGVGLGRMIAEPRRSVLVTCVGAVILAFFSAVCGSPTAKKSGS